MPWGRWRGRWKCWWRASGKSTTPISGADRREGGRWCSGAMPAVMALHNARALPRAHDLLIVDGRDGVVIVNPDESVLAEYRLRQNQWRIGTEKLERLKTTQSMTLAG